MGRNRIATLAGAVLLGLLLVACDNAHPRTPAAGQPLGKGDPVGSSASTEAADPSPATSGARPVAQAAGSTLAEAQPARAPDRPANTDRTGEPLPPPPTPRPANSAWVQARLSAVIRLYGLTEAGAALVRSLDLRQMRGQPGFFGSYGFKYWAGVGEAKPIGVMHELSHSYWGGFPVEGYPSLSWETPEGKDLPPAMERYHSDILAFMAQPPDDYEVLRQRLRNLPELSQNNLEPLLHNLEADLVYNTGGNLNLAPPILRKYWSRFLQEGTFASWHEALGWYQGLSREDRALAGKYLGFEHLDLRDYRDLTAAGASSGLPSSHPDILAQEEMQRLFDLADQFDLLIGDSRNEENFDFWRGYLRDKVELHRRHRKYVASLDLDRAADLAPALDVMADLAGQPPEAQALKLGEQLSRQPFLVNFLPALDNRALLRLFDSGTPLPQGATLQATASFVQRLNRFSVVVDRVFAAGRDDREKGAAELQVFLDSAGYENEDDLRLFFELFRDRDPPAANRLVRALDKSTLRALMVPIPTQLRFTLVPEELLELLDITQEAGPAALARGITILIEEPSGNFIIDEPFLDAMYRVVASRSPTEPENMVRVMEKPPFPLEGFILSQPQAAVALLAGDPDAAVRMVRHRDPVLSPPARIIYRLIHADPVLAAGLTQALDEKGEADMVVEALAYFAYDKSRSERVSRQKISLQRDGIFLAELLERQGSEALARRLGEAFSLYGRRAGAGQVSAGFNSRYRETLEAAAATVEDGRLRDRLQRTVALAAAKDG